MTAAACPRYGRSTARLRMVATLILFSWLLAFPAEAATTGEWVVLLTPGVSAMHMTTDRFDRVIAFDRTDYGPSQMLLPNGICRIDLNDLALKKDCYAHSFEYNVASNTARPLMVLTDTWCSSGAFAANGTLVHTGGFNDGITAIRYFQPCTDNTCNWIETGHLAAGRWYASNQVLPDNTFIVVGGRRAFSYEFVPKTSAAEGAFALSFLSATSTPNVEDNLYPFLHLSSDGNLFIFANRQSILFDYKTNTVVKTFPTIPSGPRNYPSSGSSVMLPLHYADGFQSVEVMVCGGSPEGAFAAVGAGTYMTALNDCGRMVITDANPVWAMETMPMPRVMGDMLILPTGEVLIINGAQEGTAGWGSAQKPALAPVLYAPGAAVGARFSVLAATTIPRMYHSTANVLADGRVLVGGSNTNVGYVFQGVEFPTELRLEGFSPYYLSAAYNSLRPAIRSVSTTSVLYGSRLAVRFTAATPPVAAQLAFNLYAPPFTTHAYSMNQRMLFLNFFLGPTSTAAANVSVYQAVVFAPPSAVAAPSGYYMFRILNRGIPSPAIWVQLS